MSAFAQWLFGFVQTVLIWAYNLGIDFLQVLFDDFVDLLLWIVGNLPAACQPPALPLPEGTGAVMASTGGSIMALLIQVFNWLLPLQFLQSMVVCFASAALAYVAIAPLARWAKVLK